MPPPPPELTDDEQNIAGIYHIAFADVDREDFASAGRHDLVLHLLYWCHLPELPQAQQEQPQGQGRRFLPLQALLRAWEPGCLLLPGQPGLLRQSPQRKHHSLFHSLLLKIYAFSYPPNF